MDFFKGNEDLEDEIYESLKRHGLIDGTETDLGGQKYTIANNEYYHQGQIGGEDGYAVPVMRHNDWQVPAIKPDKENWQAKNRFADGLKCFEDSTKEIGDLFAPYDMARLEVPQTYIESGYTETILSEVKEDSTIRDPPSWLIELLQKMGNRTFKISTNRIDKYNYQKEKIIPGVNDIVLTSNVGEFKTGIFLSPAFYKYKKKIDILTHETDTAYEVRYWFKGKYQTRYLSKSKSIYYHTSKFGVDTLISNVDKGSGKEGSFKHTSTDFFFFGNEMENKDYQFFQTSPPRTMANSTVYRKSSVWNTYKLVFEMNSFVMFKLPVFGSVYYKRGQFLINETPMEIGRNFVYKIKRVWVAKLDPTLEWIDKVRKDLGVSVKVPKQTYIEAKVEEKRSQGKKKRLYGVRLESRLAVVRQYVPRESLVVELSPGKFVENCESWGNDDEIEIQVELELEDFVPQPVDTHGRIEDYRDDLDPWENREVLESSGLVLDDGDYASYAL